jgi:hypothetical protein
VRHGKVERLQLQLAAPTLNSILSVIMHEWMTYGAQMQTRRWRCGGRGGDDVVGVMNARVFPEFGRDKRSDILVWSSQIRNSLAKIGGNI